MPLARHKKQRRAAILALLDRMWAPDYTPPVDVQVWRHLNHLKANR